MTKETMTFKKELDNLINRYKKEEDSRTPDFILAEYLLMCLKSGEYLVNMREKWYTNIIK